MATQINTNSGMLNTERGKPPFHIATRRLIDRWFAIGIVLSSLFFIQAITRENCWLQELSFGISVIRLMSVDAATGLLLAVIGIYLAERQFRASKIPRLQTTMNLPSSISFPGMDSPPKQSTAIKNSGSGHAIITDVVYGLAFKDSQDQYETFSDFVELIKRFNKQNLVYDRDYTMRRINPLWTIVAPGDCNDVFVANVAFLEKVKAFDYTITYESELGDKYRRTMAIVASYRDQLFMNTTAD